MHAQQEKQQKAQQNKQHDKPTSCSLHIKKDIFPLPLPTLLLEIHHEFISIMSLSCSSVLDLPDVLLGRIFLFVGDTNDFRSCELTCKTMHHLLKTNMTLWYHIDPEYCRPKLPDDKCFPPRSPRENCFYNNAISGILKWQKEPSVILSVLSHPEWNDLVHNVLDYHTSFASRQGVHNEFRVRGDTSSDLLHVVEACLVSQLSRALHVALYAKRTTVTYDDLEFQVS